MNNNNIEAGNATGNAMRRNHNRAAQAPQPGSRERASDKGKQKRKHIRTGRTFCPSGFSLLMSAAQRPLMKKLVTIGVLLRHCK